MPSYCIQLRATQDRSGNSVVVADTREHALAFVKQSLILEGLTLVVEPKDDQAEEPLTKKWSIAGPHLFNHSFA